MQLKKIKLAGFKSFVDPTELQFDSQLVGVVGPNGCGKSNIIDAVRWVMGESSAKNLRGASMADVIFSGSVTRKPVSQASIDLYFDNSAGTLGGQYSSYSEITVRREVTRDGQSNYYFNGTRCRKRDIIDVFLGTGLGARSYSIIEQGMISRVIEAKPEDLRAFLEEAAGISAYKKRKHETSLRMTHTRENLERLADISQELEKQLDKLKKQAEGARKFQEYKTEKEQLEVELLALRWNSFNNDLQAKGDKVQQFSTKLEERLARRASIDAQLERIRSENADKIEILNAAQANYYELGAQIARNEQALEHHKERKQQLERDLAEIKQNIIDSEAQLNQDDVESAELQIELAQVNTEYDEAKATLTTMEARLADCEIAMHEWRENWDKLQEVAHKAQELAEVEKIRIEELEKKTRDGQIRLDRLALEQTGLDLAGLEIKLGDLTAKLTSKEEEIKQCKLAGDELNSQISANREQIKTIQHKVNEVIGALQAARGRHAALEALQQAALRKDDKDLQNWLDKHDLSNRPRLAEQIQVADGWELAVETVLGHHLDAVCTEDFAHLSLANELPQINVALLAIANSVNTNQTQDAALTNNSKYASLASKINSELPLAGLIGGVYVADTLAQALAMQPELQTNDSIVTANGVWLGVNWLRIHAGSDVRSGVLRREQELKAVTENIELQQVQQHELRGVLDDLEQSRANLEQEQSEQRKQYATLQQNLREISNDASAVKTRFEYMQKRSSQLKQEVTELQQQLATAQHTIADSRVILAQAIEDMVQHGGEKDKLSADKIVVEQHLRDAAATTRQQRTVAHELEVKRQTLATKAQAITASLARLNKHLAELCAKRDNLSQMLAADDTPVDKVRAELNSLLEQQLVAEAELNKVRNLTEDLEQQIKVLEKERIAVENEAQQVRESLDEYRMSWQSVEIRRQTIDEEFGLRGTTVDVVLQNLTTEAEAEEWQRRIEKLANRIEALGAINLAAITEYDAELERKKYLDAQHQDLSDALNTLENAIKTIDRETKAKFKETFDVVNENFRKLFPKLFGGGRATLDLVGEDLLEAGVSVTAQPPGKRNTSIHLLSGGEKALTAVSLVFAIFQLNPAPFCMLDEVDAPLDDANVGRFCDLIVEMSAAVQFIFITHNKITMAIAKQLAGVTMKEPGVSRLVSVDIDEAIAMGVQ